MPNYKSEQNYIYFTRGNVINIHYVLGLKSTRKPFCFIGKGVLTRVKFKVFLIPLIFYLYCIVIFYVILLF